MKAKNIIRVLIVTALILSVPLVAMEFTEEVDWKLNDFVIMGILLISTGLGIELAIAKVSNPRDRIIAALVILAAFLLIWAELAVGVFGSPFAGS